MDHCEVIDTSMKQNGYRSRNPSTSIQAVATAVEGSRNNVHHVLQREGLHPYHLQSDPHRSSCTCAFCLVVSRSMLSRSAFPILRFIYGRRAFHTRWCGQPSQRALMG
ncbi:hypothetical protein TNCV_389791 [Trichonephila clavipes]|nr:hypothetical protein TNCV_389791 [Trichonephila clavipes]